MASVKISALPTTTVDNVKAGSTARLSTTGIIIPVTENSITKGLKIDQLFGAVSNLTASGDISASGDLMANRIIAANEYYLDVAKVMFAEGGQFKVGNPLTDTVVEGSSITLNASVTASSAIIDTATITTLSTDSLINGGAGNTTNIVSNTIVPANYNALLFVSNYNPSLTISSGINYTINEGADVRLVNMSNIGNIPQSFYNA